MSNDYITFDELAELVDLDGIYDGDGNTDWLDDDDCVDYPGHDDGDE